MEKTILPLPTSDNGQQPQELFVDGCKVTVRYSGQENPPALRAIKDVLISSISSNIK